MHPSRLFRRFLRGNVERFSDFESFTSVDDWTLVGPGESNIPGPPIQIACRLPPLGTHSGPRTGHGMGLNIPQHHKTRLTSNSAFH